jgi:ribonuclease HI
MEALLRMVGVTLPRRMLQPSIFDQETSPHEREANPDASLQTLSLDTFPLFPQKQTDADEKTLSVFVDGSFFPQSLTGGVACVYKMKDQVFSLCASLAPPVLCNNHVEIAAIHLALSTPALADYNLIIFTDSQTAYCALTAQSSKPTLHPSTLDLQEETLRLLQKRNAKLHWMKSRIGNPYHNQADTLAGHIARFSTQIRAQAFI